MGGRRLSEFGDFVAPPPRTPSFRWSGRSSAGRNVFGRRRVRREHRLGELKVEAGGPVDGHRRDGPARRRHHLYRRRGAGRPDRRQYRPRHLHPFRESARPVRGGRPVRPDRDGRPDRLMVLGPALSDDRVLAVAAALAGEPMSAPRADRTGRQRRDDPGGGRPPPVRPAPQGDLHRHGAVLHRADHYAAEYRLLRTGTDPRFRDWCGSSSGAAIEVETWSVPSAALAEILSASAPAVCLGRVS